MVPKAVPNGAFSDQDKVDKLYNIVCREIRTELSHKRSCMLDYWDDATHNMTLDMLCEEFSRIVNNTEGNVFRLTGATSHIVPGWNGYVNELHDLPRALF